MASRLSNYFSFPFFLEDGENRLNEHFLGRIHLGFEAVRKHLKELDVSDVISIIARGILF